MGGVRTLRGAHGTINWIDISDPSACPASFHPRRETLGLEPARQFRSRRPRTLPTASRQGALGEQADKAISYTDTYEQALDAAQAILPPTSTPCPPCSTWRNRQRPASSTRGLAATPPSDSNFMGGKDNTGPESSRSCEVVINATLINHTSPRPSPTSAAAWLDDRRARVGVEPHVQGIKDGIGSNRRARSRPGPRDDAQQHGGGFAPRSACTPRSCSSASSPRARPSDPLPRHAQRVDDEPRPRPRPRAAEGDGRWHPRRQGHPACGLELYQDSGGSPRSAPSSVRRSGQTASAVYDVGPLHLGLRRRHAGRRLHEHGARPRGPDA